MTSYNNRFTYSTQHTCVCSAVVLSIKNCDRRSRRKPCFLQRFDIKVLAAQHPLVNQNICN
jgi:hypothetical protein